MIDPSATGDGSITEISGTITVLPDQTQPDISVTFKDGKIVSTGTPTAQARHFDNSIVLPGFIDLHTHGRLGRRMREIDDDLLLKYARTGTTSFLAGEGNLSLDEIKDWLVKVEGSINNPPVMGAEVLGAHVEAPYIDPQDAGAIKPETCIQPTEETLDYFASLPIIKYMTISPYVKGAVKAIKRLTDAGIICVSGHTRGSADLLKKAHAAGLKGICHFLNNNTHFSDVFKEGGVRKPTMDEAALLYDDMHLEIICDMQHVDPVFIKIAFNIKGPSKIAAITDSGRVAGMPDGIYTRTDGRKMELKNGGVHLVESGGRCGSCIDQVEAFANLIEKIGIGYSDAARMCSLTPAEILGVDSRKGSLEPGKDADILVIDRDTYDITAVYVKGMQVEL